MPKTSNINLLSANRLIESEEKNIVRRVKSLKKQPHLALVWVGGDKQTKKFVEAKKRKATQLGIQFNLHHFEDIEERQLSALIGSLNQSKEVDGIIVQLPLPGKLRVGNILSQIDPLKDVDVLNGGDFPHPTPTGIVEILKENKVDLSSSKTCILGSGRLVGEPLAKIFKDNSWKHIVISNAAESKAEEINTCDVLISATGVEGIVSEKMVNKDMVVVDGSGIDVDLNKIQDRVRLITPAKGAVGPMTVLVLMENVVTSAERQQGN